MVFTLEDTCFLTKSQCVHFFDMTVAIEDFKLGVLQCTDIDLYKVKY